MLPDLEIGVEGYQPSDQAAVREGDKELELAPWSGLDDPLLTTCKLIAAPCAELQSVGNCRSYPGLTPGFHREVLVAEVPVWVLGSRQVVRAVEVPRTGKHRRRRPDGCRVGWRPIVQHHLRRGRGVDDRGSVEVPSSTVLSSVFRVKPGRHTHVPSPSGMGSKLAPVHSTLQLGVSMSMLTHPDGVTDLARRKPMPGLRPPGRPRRARRPVRRSGKWSTRRRETHGQASRSQDPSGRSLHPGKEVVRIPNPLPHVARACR